MRVDDIKLPPAGVVCWVVCVLVAGTRKRLCNLVGRRDIFANELAGVATVDKRSGQVPHAFRPQKLKSIKRDINRRLPLAHGVVETTVQKLLLIDRRIAIDRHAAGEPVLAELLKAIDDLVATSLAR
jgi:hypothetical protein